MRDPAQPSWHGDAHEQELLAQSSMSFLLFTLYLALNFVRPVELLAPELGELRPMLWLWLAAFLAACASAVRQQRVGASSLHFLMLGGLMLAIFASQIAQGWVGGAVGALAQFSSSSMLFVLGALNLTSMRRVAVTANVVAMSVLCMALIGIYSYQTGWRAELLVMAQNTYDDTLDADIAPEPGTAPAQDTSGRYLWRLRALGFLSDPNDFAQAMILSLPLLLIGYRPAHKLRTLATIVLPASILLYAVLLTHSRGALVSIAAMLFVGARRVLGVGKTLGLGAVFGLAILATSFGGGREFSTQEESAGDRIDAWYAGFMMFKSHPLFGIGYGNFTDHHPLTAHNSFVLCLAELGLVGYAFWIGMLVLAFIGLRRAREAAETDTSRVAGLLTIALVGFLVCAWFLSRTYQPTLYLLLAMCAATWCNSLRGNSATAGEASIQARALMALQSPWRWPWLKGMALSMAGSVLLVQAFIVAKRVGGVG